MTTAALLKRASGMISKLVFVSLCALALAGCAQFEDSFGELWGPGSLSGTASLSANGTQSFTIGGMRVGLAEGKMI